MVEDDEFVAIGLQEGLAHALDGEERREIERQRVGIHGSSPVRFKLRRKLALG